MPDLMARRRHTTFGGRADHAQDNAPAKPPIDLAKEARKGGQAEVVEGEQGQGVPRQP